MTVTIDLPSNAADPAVIATGTGPVAGASAESMGGKAFGLLRLAQLGLPVPPAFVLGTAYCKRFFGDGGRLPPGFREVLARGVSRLEEITGRQFGGQRRPLLLSVRSGAPVSMPGMMDTVLNIGLNEAAVAGLIRLTGNPRMAWDSYRRLVQGFGEIVLDVRPDAFDRVVDAQIAAAGIASERELDWAALRQTARDFLEVTHALGTRAFPQDPMDQLEAAAEAVFRSWMSPRAAAYRKLNAIDDSIGTAVTIQAMAFGNAGGTSGAGVGFTRNPATGENALYIDFLFNAQGEDVVSGRHAVRDTERLPLVLPAVHADLLRIKSVLEREFGDVQDFEFTVESGRLYLLQVRRGKRTPWAALKIAVDLVDEGVIAPEAALARLDGLDLNHLERVRLTNDTAQPLAEGTPAGTGVAVGSIALEPATAAQFAAAGTPAILVRTDIDTADIAGFAAAEGILTASGGRTSHAAVVARQLGKVCVVGCAGVSVDLAARRLKIGPQDFHEGDFISLDGDRGRIFAGRLPVERERPTALLERVAEWRGQAQRKPAAP
jgi:pyruvate,orthophosphate dikinase